MICASNGHPDVLWYFMISENKLSINVPFLLANPVGHYTT